MNSTRKWPARAAQENGSELGLVQITKRRLRGDMRLRRLLCGKAAPFRRRRPRTNLLRPAWKAQPSRWGGQVENRKLGRKGRAFPHSGAAEPLRALGFSANLDGLGKNAPLPSGAVLL